MPRSLSARGRAPSVVAGAETVDVTPIMNMFVILIPFLVSMAVFSQLAVLRFTLPGENQNLRADPALPFTVALTPQRLAITHGEQLLTLVARGPDGHDFARLTAELGALRGAADTVAGSVVIAVDDGAVFDETVRCMDACRAAGFDRISLAEGTNLDADRKEAPDERP